MAISTTVSHPCARCGQRVEALLHKSFVIEDDASLRTILDNRFHVLDCPSCGERRAFDADFLVTNKPREIFLQVIGKDADVADMRESMTTMLGGAAVFARIVPDRNALVEKVRLWSQKLDDVAMEVVKFYLRIQIGDREGKTERRFEKVEGEDVVFLVRAPGQPVERRKMPLRLYNESIRDLGTGAHARELEVDERLARKLIDSEKPAAPAPASPKGPTIPLKVTHAGTDRRGRRFVSDGKVILLGDLVAPTGAETPSLLTTETVENLISQKASHWTPLVGLVKSKLHAATYRTSDDVALGEGYVSLLLALGRPMDLGTTERLGPVLLREGADIVGTLMPLKLPPELSVPPPQAAPAVDEERAPCPVCRGLVPRGEGFCEACGVGLAWQDGGGVRPSHPELAPGRVLVSESFEMKPFPGRTTLEEARAGVMDARVVRGGKLITYHTAVTSSFVDYARPLRDACVRATFTALDPGARIGMCARHSIIGGIQIYYLFDMIPLTGAAWCSRGVQTPEHASSARLCPDVKLTPVAPGVSVELELRVAGATLRAYVNGQPVLAAHDAAFGSGAFGIRVGREHDASGPVRIVCHGYEVREVMP